MRLLKVMAIGDSLGVILPADILDRLNVELGDSIDVVVTPSSIELLRADRELTNQMEIADRVAKEDLDVLEKLKDDI